jgi:leucyl/phenylalanyl-tRNA--protein transferase
MVLYVDEFRVSRSLRKRLRQGEFEVRIDTAFAEVVRACAHAPREGQDGTWITPAVMDAYVELHRLGYCHCVEAWHEGALAGGLYGLALGRVFFGESMFARRTDASKVALAALVSVLRERGVELIDCQQETAHLASLGARPIPRAAFAAELERLIHSSDPPHAFPRGPRDVRREQAE